MTVTVARAELSLWYNKARLPHTVMMKEGVDAKSVVLGRHRKSL
jgi:hypothetical protein